MAIASATVPAQQRAIQDRPQLYPPNGSLSDTSRPTVQSFVSRCTEVSAANAEQILPRNTRTPTPQRAKYIQALQKAALLDTQYAYIEEPVLVRMSGKLTPAQAAICEKIDIGAPD